MKMSFYSLVMFGLIVFVVSSGCSDSCANPEEISRYDTLLVDNGFYANWQEGNEGVEQAYAFPIQSSSAFLIQKTDGNEEKTRVLVVSADILFHGTAGESVVVRVMIPDTVSREYEWQNALENGVATSDSYVMISIDGKQYIGMEGTTELVSYRNIAGNRISGTFTGRFRTEFGEEMTVNDGRFNAGIEKDF